ncbi:MAG: flagellar hook-basal body complex protein FliE [Proteobacteria bacterium]|nr:flagellar hook-basal body complex protein FliE [Pseudomonadota bacterium]MBU1584665.1 flagellar hook-basal body complex protein FliE [Pseudomonadota bacterium]MBU2452803.1 flagellar hook-basal body complex protein FliE [Pseudomonadota bacterium]MBU2631533.1 flagellar hook-basal body complex protein FliE [Pseudomonadota bacterium]
MTQIEGINKISLHTEPLAQRINRRSPEFAKRIEAAVKDVNTKQQIADDSIEKVIKGEMGIHEGMMAIGKAETSLKILAQVRNKVMSAYNEVMRMQI